MKYEVEIASTAERSLKKIPKEDRIKIVEKIDALSEDPMPAGSIKLQGHKPSFYRIRSGDYRVIYTIKNDLLIVLVVEIGHRREVYR